MSAFHSQPSSGDKKGGADAGAVDARADDIVRLDRGDLRLQPVDGRASLGPAARAWQLAAVFGAELLRSTGRKFLFALAFLPAAALVALVLARTRIEAFAVADEEQLRYVLETYATLASWTAAWSGFAVATVGVGQIPRDLRAGALLLYFTRPVGRLDYLLGRGLATTLWLLCGLAIPVALVTAAMVVGFGAQPAELAGISPWLFWPGLLLAGLAKSLVQAIWLAAVALGVGASLRGPTAAGLAVVGGLLGTRALAGILSSVWGRESMIGAVDLVAGLDAPSVFLLRPFGGVPPPHIAVLEAAIGLGLWTALAVVGWRVAMHVVYSAPLGRGRS